MFFDRFRRTLTRPFFVTLAVACICGQLLADAPEISDPEVKAPAGSMPGEFPVTVTAANVDAAPIPGSTLGGDGSNNMRVQIPASGPIAWTESRHNEGDIAMLIGPFDPDDPSYFPPDAFVDDYSPLQGEPFAATTLAWRVNRDNGALLATVRHNGVDNQDTLDGTAPVGPIHGAAYFNTDLGQGWGYRMNDGVFANGGAGSADLQMGVAGPDGDRGEAVFNTAVAFFPYEEGWLGAWVNARTEDGSATFAHGNSSLELSSVLWFDAGLAAITFPEANANDGMLFVAPSSGDNASDLAASYPDVGGGGWVVTVREDSDMDVTGQSYKADDNAFQFLYVPYSAPGLIGGHFSGEDGIVATGSGEDRFTLEKTASGEYSLTILGTDGQTKQSEDDGMLILSVASQMPGAASPVPDKAFLSYEYSEQAESFVIQSREAVANNQGMFGADLILRDTDFYFAYVDFENPLKLSVTCDLTGDGTCGVEDIDALVTAISAGNSDPANDINGDGQVNAMDVDQWLAVAGEVNLGAGRAYLPGDANLDGSVDAADLNAVGLSWQQPVVAWSSGNFTADGAVDAADLNVLALNWQASAAPNAASAVPEPAGLLLALLLVVPVLVKGRRF